MDTLRCVFLSSSSKANKSASLYEVNSLWNLRHVSKLFLQIGNLLDYLVECPSRTVVRPGTYCQFSLRCFELGFESCSLVHVLKFITVKLLFGIFFQHHSRRFSGINHDPAVLVDFNQLSVNQIVDVPSVLAINQISA